MQSKMHQIIAIILSLIVALSSSKRLEFECRSLQSKSLTCQLPSSHHIISRNPTIWFKNLNQARLSEMTTVEIYNYTVSSFMPSRLGQTFPHIGHLMFRRSTVQHVLRRNFLHMRQLKKLKLNYNLIEEIPHDVFHDLPALESLDLRANMIFELPADLLVNMRELKYFSVEHNNIEVIDRGTFRNNPLIEEIYLNSNEILNVEVDFSLMANVKTIDLSTNVDECNFRMEIYDGEPTETKVLLRSLFQARVDASCGYMIF